MVVLLKDRESLGIRQRLEEHTGGVDGGGYVGEGDLVEPPREFELSPIPYKRRAFVIDRQGERSFRRLRPGGPRRRQGFIRRALAAAGDRQSGQSEQNKDRAAPDPNGRTR